MKQTAIEWLMLEKALIGYIDDEMVEQAKQLEKSHMINFFSYGCMTENDNLTSEKILEQFRNYYDKQFKTDLV